MFGIQPLFQEPILASQGAIGTAVRIGSLVEFEGKQRFVLDIRKKIVNTPGRPCFEGDIVGPCPQLPIKMTVVEVRIAEGFKPIGDVSVIKM